VKANCDKKNVYRRVLLLFFISASDCTYINFSLGWSSKEIEMNAVLGVDNALRST